ncbi:MAG TPA: protein phosphatase 2C domain-containing protein [Candidatus Acidoferrales bacterium]|jgi:serine/threonine protein phosphatase PrpC|nr:protein phosphatase 2C domain-containing protein [Candidatus Acidoferrales bacterium]
MMLAYGATHPGRRRENNEDAFHIEDALSAAILADGMGGENCGEVGSEITVRAVKEYLAAPEEGLNREEVVKEAIRAANRQVIAAAKLHIECDGMGSTIVMAVWNGPDVIIANVGDSRAYLYRAGDLRQLSYDQNFANDLRTRLGFSEERLLTMPNRHVLTMAVGPFEHVLVRTHHEHLEPGDRLLLCSDGLHGSVDHATITQVVGTYQDLLHGVDALIECALENGGPDNVTAILLEYRNEKHG